MKAFYTICILFLFVLISCHKKPTEAASQPKEIDDQIELIVRDMDSSAFTSALSRVSTLYQNNNLHRYPKKKYYLLCLESEILYYNALFDLGADKANEALFLVQKEIDSNSNFLGNAYNLLGINAENFMPAYRLVDIYTKSWQNLEQHHNPLLSRKAHVASNLGQIYFKSGEIENAEKWLSISNTLCLEDTMWRTLTINYATLSSIATYKKEWTRSKALLDSSYSFYSKKNDQDLYLFYLHSSAELHMAKGNILEGLNFIIQGELFINQGSDISKMGVFDYYKNTRLLASKYKLDNLEQKILNKEGKLFLELDSARKVAKENVLKLYNYNQELLLKQENQMEVAREKLQFNKELLNLTIVGILALLLISASIVYSIYQKRLAERIQFDKEKKEIELGLELSKAKEKYDAILSERIRISKEFHDGIAPNLSSIKLICEVLQLKMPSDEMVKQMPALIDNTISEIKFLINEINPKTLLNEGLEAALNRFAAICNVSQVSEVIVKSEIGSLRFENDIELNLYRIIQELVYNALKHTNTTTVNIDLSKSENFLLANIQDFGTEVTFDFENDFEGNGISNIKSRAKLIKAEITVNSELGKGSLMQIRIPLC